jgi:murein DD-endopeptidase MepM/ murein hydrolase activator NlpD
LKVEATYVTVAEMPRSSAPGRSARSRTRPRRRSARHRRWRAALVAAGLAGLVIVVLGAFGSSSPSVSPSLPAGSSRLPPAGPPHPQVIALQGALRLQLPVAQSAVTAIGYHAAGTDALPLDPIGRRANEDLLARAFHRIFGGGGKPGWYQLGGGQGPSTGAVDVGAPEGTDVYSPVDGTVVGIHAYVINGKKLGNVLELQPDSSPGSVVAVSHFEVDKSLAVGTPVSAGVSKLGRILDFSTVERQALATHTHDAGNHVTLEVRPSPAGALS